MTDEEVLSVGGFPGLLSPSLDAGSSGEFLASSCTVAFAVSTYGGLEDDGMARHGSSSSSASWARSRCRPIGRRLLFLRSYFGFMSPPSLIMRLLPCFGRESISYAYAPSSDGLIVVSRVVVRILLPFYLNIYSWRELVYSSSNRVVMYDMLQMAKHTTGRQVHRLDWQPSPLSCARPTEFSSFRKKKQPLSQTSTLIEWMNLSATKQQSSCRMALH